MRRIFCSLLLSCWACAPPLDTSGVDGGAEDPDRPLDFSLEDLRVVPAKVQVSQGRTLQLNAVLGSTFGTETLQSEPIRWSSADPSIAVVDEAGRVSGVAPGETIVSAEVLGERAESQIKVIERFLTDIFISPTTLSLVRGRSFQMSALGRYNDATGVTLTSTVTWSSSAPQIATVDEDGLLTSIDVGEAQITAAHPEDPELVSMPLTLRVIETNTSTLAEQLSITPQLARLSLGDSLTMRAILGYINGTADDVTREVSWSSSNLTVAIIDEEGRIDALTEGVTMIRATLGDLSSAPSQIEIAQLLAPIDLVITPTAAVASIGQIVSAELQALYSRGPPRTVTATASWSSSDESVATVTAGQIMAQSSGEARITATYEGRNARIQLTITP